MLVQSNNPQRAPAHPARSNSFLSRSFQQNETTDLHKQIQAIESKVSEKKQQNSQLLSEINRLSHEIEQKKSLSRKTESELKMLEENITKQSKYLNEELIPKLEEKEREFQAKLNEVQVIRKRFREMDSSCRSLETSFKDRDADMKSNHLRLLSALGEVKDIKEIDQEIEEIKKENAEIIERNENVLKKKEKYVECIEETNEEIQQILGSIREIEEETARKKGICAARAREYNQIKESINESYRSDWFNQQKVGGGSLDKTFGGNYSNNTSRRVRFLESEKNNDRSSSMNEGRLQELERTRDIKAEDLQKAKGSVRDAEKSVMIAQEVRRKQQRTHQVQILLSILLGFICALIVYGGTCFFFKKSPPISP